RRVRAPRVADHVEGGRVVRVVLVEGDLAVGGHVEGSAFGGDETPQVFEGVHPEAGGAAGLLAGGDVAVVVVHTERVENPFEAFPGGVAVPRGGAGGVEVGDLLGGERRVPVGDIGEGRVI